MYKKILVPLDGSKLAECIFPHIETIIGGCGVQELVLIRVLEPLQFATYADINDFIGSKEIETLLVTQETEAKSYLEKTLRHFQRQALNVRSELLSGRATEAIGGYAEKGGFDLIVMATHGRGGISRFAFGSVADRVLRSVCVPVLMVRAPGCVSGF